MSAEKCVKEYLETRMPGLYYALDLVAHVKHGVRLETLLLRDRGKALDLLRKLYGEEAAELLFKLLEEACFKNKGVKKGVEDA